MKNHHALNEPIFTIVINLSHRFFFRLFVHLFTWYYHAWFILIFFFQWFFFLKKNTLLECILVKSLIVKSSMLKAKNSKKDNFWTKAKKEIAIENHMDFVRLESFDQCSQILKSWDFLHCEHQNQTWWCHSSLPFLFNSFFSRISIK